MSSAQAQNILRVTVEHNGKMQERRFPSRETVTVGADGANTFVVSESGLPKVFPVFDATTGGYVLVFTDTMEGRIHVGGVEFDLQTLVSSGKAKKRDDAYQFQLNDRSSGQVKLGSLTIHFDFTKRTETLIELPANIRGSFIRGLDRLFLWVLTGSLVVHGLLGIWVMQTELPPEQELELSQLPDRFARVIMPAKREPIVPEKEETTAVAPKPQPEEKKQIAVEPAANEKESSPPKMTTAERAAIQQQVAQKGLLKVLTARGGATSTAFSDVLGASADVRDVEAALKGAKGIDVATAEALSNQGPRGGTAGEVANIGNLGTSGGGNVNLGNKGDVKVSGKVRDAAPEVESADVDRAALTRYVKARMSAIQSCYERELKRNPSLKGKLLVRFAITPSGKSADIDIEENSLGSDDVASCIRNVIRTWVFPFKPESEVMVSYPFLFTPSN